MVDRLERLKNDFDYLFYSRTNPVRVASKISLVRDVLLWRYATRQAGACWAVGCNLHSNYQKLIRKSAKLRYIIQILKAHPGEGVLIFSDFPKFIMVVERVSSSSSIC